jgi:hypothetical protein
MCLRSSYSAPRGWICAGAALAAALLLGKDVRLDKLLEKISEKSSIPMFSDNADAKRISITFQICRWMKDCDVFSLALKSIAEALSADRLHVRSMARTALSDAQPTERTSPRCTDYAECGRSATGGLKGKP